MASTIKANLSIYLSDLVIPYRARAADVKKAIMAAIDLNKESVAANITKNIVNKYKKEKKITCKDIDINNTKLTLEKESATDITLVIDEKEKLEAKRNIIAKYYPKVLDIITKHGYDKYKHSDHYDSEAIVFFDKNDNYFCFTFEPGISIYKDKNAILNYCHVSYKNKEKDYYDHFFAYDEEYILYRLGENPIENIEFDYKKLYFSLFFRKMLNEDNGYKAIFNGRLYGKYDTTTLIYKKETVIESGLITIEEYHVTKYERQNKVPEGRLQGTHYGYRHQVEYSVSLIDNNNKNNNKNCYCRQYRDSIDSYDDKELNNWLSKYVEGNPEDLFKEEKKG